MSIQIKYNYLEQAYPDMLEGIGMLIQKAKLSGRFDSVQLSEEEIEHLQKAKELCELKIVELWDNREHLEFKGLCSTYFDIASQLPIQFNSELLVYEQIKLIAFGYLGEHWHFVKQYLKNHSNQFEAIQVGESWNLRILNISFKAIVHLIRKENWQEISQSVALINQLRQEQNDFENTFLNHVNQESRPYGAAELVSLYHFAKCVDVLANYLIEGRPLEPENELQYHTGIALEYAQKSGNLSLGLLYQFFEAFADLVIEYAFSNNSIKSGDIIKDHIGKIEVRTVRAYIGFNNIPECIYKGVELKANGQPKKNSPIREVYQSNIIQNS